MSELGVFAQFSISVDGNSNGMLFRLDRLLNLIAILFYMIIVKFKGGKLTEVI